jgi:hypothetical protein
MLLPSLGAAKEATGNKRESMAVADKSIANVGKDGNNL